MTTQLTPTSSYAIPTNVKTSPAIISTTSPVATTLIQESNLDSDAGAVAEFNSNLTNAATFSSTAFSLLPVDGTHQPDLSSTILNTNNGSTSKLLITATVAANNATYGNWNTLLTQLGGTNTYSSYN